MEKTGATYGHAQRSASPARSKPGSSSTSLKVLPQTARGIYAAISTSRACWLGCTLESACLDSSIFRFDGDTGVASVREKRLALEGEARGDTPPTPAEDKVTIDPERHAKEVARSMFATSNYEYGSRGSLELFGVAQVPCPYSHHSSSIARVLTLTQFLCSYPIRIFQHGISATITKPGSVA